MDEEATVRRIVAALADLPGVAAISLGGSTVTGLADISSDLDVYVYYHEPPELATRWNNIARLSADDSALADRLEALIDDLCGLIEVHK